MTEFVNSDDLLPQLGKNESWGNIQLGGAGKKLVKERQNA